MKIKLFENFEENNTFFIHKDTSLERLVTWQKENKNTKIKIGDFVKIRFQEGNLNEWMWVKITKVKSLNEFSGILDNTPSRLRNVKLGDSIDLQRSQIAQLTE